MGTVPVSSFVLCLVSLPRALPQGTQRDTGESGFFSLLSSAFFALLNFFFRFGELRLRTDECVRPYVCGGVFTGLGGGYSPDQVFLLGFAFGAYGECV
jgi:hypothetical protein